MFELDDPVCMHTYTITNTHIKLYRREEYLRVKVITIEDFMKMYIKENLMQCNIYRMIQVDIL